MNRQHLQKAPQLLKKIRDSQEHLSNNRKRMEKQFLLSLILVSLLCVFSYFYLDQPIALFMANLKHGVLSFSNADLTSRLTNIAYFITIIIMSLYVIFHFLNISSRLLEMGGVLCLGMAIAFFIKEQLQLLFGRIPPRYGDFEQLNFVRKKALYGFNFMQIGSFPSGHMMIFSCVLMLFTFYYPRLRYACYALLTVLAFLLVYDNYHFLSDIIAGTYIGILIAFALKFLLKIDAKKINHQTTHPL